MRYAIIAITIIIALLPPHTATAKSDLTPQIPAEMYAPDVAQAWMDLLYERVSVIGIYPPTAARVYGYAGVALYEAVAAGTTQLDSLHGHLNAMPTMPQPDPMQVYDWPSVVNGALAAVSEPILSESPVSTLFNSTQREQVRRHVTRLRDQIKAERELVVDAATVTASMVFGTEIGQAVEAWAATDGFAETRTMTYTIPTGDDPSLWVTTPLNADPIEPHWHLLRPMALVENTECRMPLAIEFSTEIHSPFYWQVMEIYQMSIKRTQEHEEIADFWDDQAGEAGMHPGHWMLIANQLVSQQNLNLVEAAQMFLLAGIAVHDAGIAAWTQKYDELLIRPETYIQRYIDPTWEPFLATPNFPEYPSGHATFGAATAEVLTAIWGVMALTDHGGIVEDMGRTRQFTSLEAAAYENGLSRLYGGIHYRMGMEAGLRTGECIGQRILERLGLIDTSDKMTLESQMVAKPFASSQLEQRPRVQAQGNPLSFSELDIPRQWIELIHQQVDKQTFDLPTTARMLAYMSIALHEALLEENESDSLTSLLHAVPSLPPRDRQRRYDGPTIAIGALATVANEMLLDDNDRNPAQNAIRGLRNLQVRNRLQTASRATVEDSLAHGNAIGAAILAWAATDGFAEFANRPFVVPIGNEAYWRQTSRGIAPERPYWAALRPLLQSNAGENFASCSYPLTLDFTLFPGTTFHRQMNEVYHMVDRLTDEQAATAEFWGYGDPIHQAWQTDEIATRGNSVTHWLLIAAQTIEQQQLSLTEAGLLYAIIGATVHDTLIQSWESKYQTFLLRPQTYINAHIDESWQPYLTTPNSPSFPSASASVGAATAEILTAYFGVTNFIDAMGVVDGKSTLRHFTTFEAAAYAAGMAELYAGINLRTSIEAGLRQGECVGQSAWRAIMP